MGKTVIEGWKDAWLRDVEIEYNQFLGCRIARLWGNLCGYRIAEDGSVYKKWKWEKIKVPDRGRPVISLSKSYYSDCEEPTAKVIVPHLVLSVFVGLRPSPHHECHHGERGKHCHAADNLRWLLPGEHDELHRWLNW